jgi:hypothetical protein
MSDIAVSEDEACKLGEARELLALTEGRQVRFGCVLGTLRRERQLKLVRFSETLKPRVALSFVSEVESGEAKLPDGRIIDWANCLHTSPSGIAAWALYAYRPYHFFRLAGANPDLHTLSDISPFVKILKRRILNVKLIARRISGISHDEDQVDVGFLEQAVVYGRLLGSYLMNSRKRIGMLQRDLASRVGYSSPSTISAIEADRLFIQDEVMGSWENALQLDAAIFYSLCLRVFMPSVYSILSGVELPVHARDGGRKLISLRSRAWSNIVEGKQHPW